MVSWNEANLAHWMTYQTLFLVCLAMIIFVRPIRKLVLEVLLALIYVPCMLLVVAYIKLLSFYRGVCSGSSDIDKYN